MRIEHTNGKVARSLHAVIIPYPSQGHITPCFQLAKKLVRLGFRITFVNTEHNHERIMKSRSKAMEPEKDIEFVPVSDGLPDDHPRTRDISGFCNESLKMGPTFEKLFVNLQLESPITCVIRDIRFPAVHGAAKRLGIPVVAFVTPSAISSQCYYHLPTFTSTGILPLPPPPAHVSTPSLDTKNWTLGPPRSDEEAAVRQTPLTCLPGGSPTMRVDDLPTFILSHDPDSFFVHLHRDIQNPLVPDCECILYNTFDDLEGDILDAMGDMNSNIYAIGPLVLNSTTVDGVEELAMAGAGSAMWEEDSVSLSWLDDQNPKSVLFVSFGSLATITTEQMQEFACGLEMSGHAFLWAIRSELIECMCENKKFETTFSEFLIRTRDRGLLVPWAPQTAVLSHPSVAAFLTHCGWNSTIESISSGIPMLGWPRFADQNTNCHYITHVWKIGLELQNQAKDDKAIVLKEEVAQKVRKIMATEEMDLEVDKIRTNCRNFRMAARKAVAKGGSSQIALAKFVELIERRTTHPAPPS